jgi:hypothetical protein
VKTYRVKLISLRVGHSPAFFDGSNISNNLAMVRPGKLDGFWCSDTSTTWITGRTEPMVLGSTSCASLDSGIGDTVN